MTDVKWTSIQQTDSDSVAFTWTAPEGAACNVLMHSGGEWTAVASGLTGGEFCIDSLSMYAEYAFALEFSGSETVMDGETALTFSYSFRTEPQRITLMDCDYSWWIQDETCILTGAALWQDTETLEARIPSRLGGFPVTRIGNKAFTCMSGLTEVHIPDTVLSISSTAFCGCPDLTRVEMKNSVLSIGDYAFAACPALKDVRLADSIRSIGEYAFWNDSALTHIDLPESLQSLGRKSLYGTKITSITLPNGMTEIGSQVWNDDLTEIITGESAICFRVKDGILYADDMTRLVWVPRSLGIIEYTAPDTVMEIAPYAFANCSSLQTAAFPGGLLYIRGSAFENCAALESLSGLDPLISIEDRAFYGCSALRDDAFQNLTGLESVGAHAFENCAALENMPLGGKLTWLGESAFEGCTALVSARLGSAMTGIGSAAFYGCTALESVGMPSVLSEAEGFGSYMFYGCSRLKSISVPAGVTKLDSYTFHGCSELESLTLPEGLKTIGNAVCYKCNALTELVIPDSVTSIGSYAFTYCRALKELELPACPVGSYGFGACTSLKSVRFVENSSRNISLANRAFYYCTSLESAYLPANVTSIHAKAFESCSKVTLYVAENSAAHTFAVENGLTYELTA